MAEITGATSESRAYTGTGVTDETQSVAVGVSNHVINTRPLPPGRFSGGYDDFFGGNITCPTCDGTGRVSRDRESELVALIPMNDKRLHPRRTLLYVSTSIALCIIIAGLLLFFLFPRSISIRNSQPTLTPVQSGYDQNHTEMHLTIVNMYNVTNENFFQVQLESVSVSLLFNQRIINTVTNSTSLTIPMKSTKLYHVMINATFSSELDYVIQYCWLKDESFLVQFQAMATFSYFQKSEEMTLNTYQYIRCPKNRAAVSETLKYQIQGTT